MQPSDDVTEGEDRPAPWPTPGAPAGPEPGSDSGSGTSGRPTPWSVGGEAGRPAPWPSPGSGGGEAGSPAPWPSPGSGGGEAGSPAPWPSPGSGGGEAGRPAPWPSPGGSVPSGFSAGGGFPPAAGGGFPPAAGGGSPGFGPGSLGSDPYWTPQRPRRSSVNVVVTSILVVVAVLAGVAIGSTLPRSTDTASAGGQPSGTGNGLGSGGSAATLPNGGAAPPGTSLPSAQSPGPSSVAAIAARVDPGLVDIDTQLGYQHLAAAGTGIVLSRNGLILTNNHVVNGSTLIQATDIGNKKTYRAVVVGYDESSDIAVIQLQGASGLATASIGDSASAAVGAPVVAIGNAGGTGGTPSAAGGSITALGQSITASDSGDGTSEKLKGLIQTNANVQPGDSGGSLVNTNGAVVGVDTAASQGFSFSSGGGTEGFAIPINSATALAQQIESEHGSASVHVGPTAFLGVSFEPSSTGEGLRNSVFQVIPGTAANQAGIAVGDTITGFGPANVASPGDLTKALVTYHPGDHVVVLWKTPQGGARRADVTLTMGPNA